MHSFFRQSRQFFLFLCLIVMVAGCAGSGAASMDGSVSAVDRVTDGRSGEQSAARLLVDGRPMDYLLYLPENFERQKNWPLVLFLHGAGERGEDLELVKRHGPPKLAAAGEDFPFIIVSPQHPQGSWWQTNRLLSFLDGIMRIHPVDASRVYATGLSMGGYGVWALAVAAPEQFAAVAPISGGGDPGKSCEMKDVPVWAFHGAKDGVVPVEKSRNMVLALRACEADEVRYMEYPEAGHDAWTQTYANPEVFEWMLSHSRK